MNPPTPHPQPDYSDLLQRGVAALELLAVELVRVRIAIEALVEGHYVGRA